MERENQGLIPVIGQLLLSELDNFSLQSQYTKELLDNQIVENRNELLNNWEAIQNGQTLKMIAPLE